MHIHNQQLSEYDTNAPLFKAKRLIQLYYIAEVGIFISMLAEYSLGHRINSLMLLITGLILLPLKFFVNKGKVIASATFFLVIVTLSMSLLLINGEGIKDIATLTFPVILIFSVMVGNHRLFTFLFVLMTSTILFVTFSNVSGYYVNEVIPVSYADGIIALCILSASAHSTWVWSKDRHNLFVQLVNENANARASQKLVRHAAHHDGLTSLPNRLLAADRFSQAVALASRSKFSIALMYIDLDNFKIVNDSLGHEAGDEYLKIQASRLKNAVREVDTVCRQGGDEFLILLNEIKDYEDVIAIAEKIIFELSQRISVSSTDFEGSGSIGIAMWPTDGKDYDTLLKKADMAMYHAKDTGKNNFQFYDEKLNDNLLEYLQLVAELKIALQENQFELFYQPKLSLGSEKVIGAEALLRWRHPERGLIFPNDFIPAAEQSGLIVDIGKWVIGEACATSKQWQQSGFKDVSIAVNVSPIQFMYGDVYNYVKAAIEKYNYSADKLELEITESLLLDESEELKRTFKKLNQLNVNLSIDDFGTGYSNLKYLKLFHISLIKIDQSFVRNLDTDNQDQSIVKAIIQMAKSLNMHVVAEGVENVEILDYLKQNHCDFAQGYLWAKPISISEFKEFLNKHY